MQPGQHDANFLRRSWFARAWAVAALFHLAAEPRGALETQPGLAALSVLLALSAALVLYRPRRALLALCLLIPLHAWAEAPVVGNHWVLAALVSLAFCLGALLRGAVPGGASLRAARLTLLVAYSFAAFAKLNWDFVNPAVSCVVFYQEQLVRSWGLPGLSVAGAPALGRGLAVLTIITELAVAALLAFRPARRLGLVLAYGFHWLLALDLHQHFWDFSSVLFAGFLLFLDDAQVRWLRQQLAPLARWTPAPALLAALAGAAGVAVAVLNVLPLHLGYREALQQAGHQAWWLYGTALVVLVTAGLFAPRPSPARAAPARLPALLLLPAVLAGINGLTPYLEVKTGYGWNMYSNLRTQAGQTNHLLLPGTWDLTGAQRDLVEIVASSDPTLQRLHDDHYALTHSEFRRYAQQFPDSAATYRYRGTVRHAARLGDDPAAQPPPSLTAQKLRPFRVVDLERAERCQPVYTPAR